ncbi:hypothetical protein C8J57DRAFT_1622134 [Mycena rebaudengoi]|nr:hypothetical protein C8J57DRAFT_1622134 [Mycena rebaudengoi]
MRFESSDGGQRGTGSDELDDLPDLVDEDYDFSRDLALELSSNLTQPDHRDLLDLAVTYDVGCQFLHLKTQLSSYSATMSSAGQDKAIRDNAMLLAHLKYTADLNSFFQRASTTMHRPSLPVVTGSGGPKVLPKLHTSTHYAPSLSQSTPPSDSADAIIAPAAEPKECPIAHKTDTAKNT